MPVRFHRAVKSEPRDAEDPTERLLPRLDLKKPDRAPNLDRSVGPRRHVIEWLRARGPVGRGAVTFASYLVMAIVIHAGPVVLHLGSRCVGTCRQDGNLFVWVLAWMPHALGHGLNPLWTTELWAPGGLSLAWTTSVPGPAAVMAPVTELLGPLTSLNLLLLAAPALAGWAAYLVCNQATRRFWPSFAGGCVFAFSPYVGQYMRAQLNIVLIFLVPLAVYLVIRSMRETLRPIPFVILFAALLVGQVSIGTEIFATMTLFGVIAFGGVSLLGPPDLRRAAWRTGLLVAAAYAAAGIVLTPFFIEVFSHMPTTLLRSGVLNSADLLSYVVPPANARFGGAQLSATSASFVGLPAEAAYVGIVLIGVLTAFAFEHRRHRSTWLLIGFIAVVVLLSFGPVLHIAGTPTIWLPGALIAKAPLLREALPSRFPLYLWLALAVVVAIWTATDARRGAWLRYGAVAVGIALVSLNLGATNDTFHGSMPVPAFFSDGTYRSYLSPGEIVLTVPEQLADDMVWQADTDMGFRLPRAYVGPAHPVDSAQDALRRSVAPRIGVPPSSERLARFLHDHAVGAVIVVTPVPPRWLRLMRETIGAPPTIVDGVAIWSVSADQP
jgi:hypothetical protein